MTNIISMYEFCNNIVLEKAKIQNSYECGVYAYRSTILAFASLQISILNQPRLVSLHFLRLRATTS